jgi:hypothetical protein
MRPDERPQQARQALRAGDVAAMPDHVSGHELGRLAWVVLVEHLVDLVARELLVGLELLGGHGRLPLTRLMVNRTMTRSMMVMSCS